MCLSLFYVWSLSLSKLFHLIKMVYPTIQKSTKRKHRLASLNIRNKYRGGNLLNLLGKFEIFFVILGLKILRLGLKYFLKQISLKGDVNYCKNHKVSFFYEQLLHKSTFKLLKILWICLRSFVNFHPVVSQNHKLSYITTIMGQLIH